MNRLITSIALLAVLGSAGLGAAQAQTVTRPTRVIFDPADLLGGGAIFGEDNATSVISRYPSIVVVQEPPGTTVATVQARVNSDGEWIDVGVAENGDGDTAFTFSTKFNFVRVICAEGDCDYVVFDQD